MNSAIHIYDITYCLNYPASEIVCRHAKITPWFVVCDMPKRRIRYDKQMKKKHIKSLLFGRHSHLDINSHIISKTGIRSATTPLSSETKNVTMFDNIILCGRMHPQELANVRQHFVRNSAKDNRCDFLFWRRVS